MPVYSPSFCQVLIPTCTEGRLRLRRPGCLVLHRRGGLPVQKQSPTWALAGPSIQWLRSSAGTCYRYTRPATCYTWQTKTLFPIWFMTYVREEGFIYFWTWQSNRSIQLKITENRKTKKYTGSQSWHHRRDYSSSLNLRSDLNHLSSTQ